MSSTSWLTCNLKSATHQGGHMERQPSHGPETGSPGVERYTHGYSPVFSGFLSRRSASSNAAFFLPHLRPGMDLLDCGCGPGTITTGLAQIVYPGKAIGVDLEASQVELATVHAAQQHIDNLGFSTANIYALPFPDGSFDAVFGHSILEHVGDPLRALLEMRRVLKTDGLGGFREVDQGGNLLEPSLPLLEQSFDLQEAVWRSNGGDPRLGRKLRWLLRRAGFAQVEMSGSYDVYSTAEEVESWSQRMADSFSSPSLIEHLTASGLASRSTINQTRKAWADWAKHPDAFYARARVEAVARAE